MNVVIFGNTKKSEFPEVSKKILSLLKKYRCSPYTIEPCAECLDLPVVDTSRPEDYSMILSLGGDGTILRAVRLFPEKSPPIVGINLGQLGFMADLSIQDDIPLLEDILSGRFNIVEQPTLTVSIEGDATRYFALNDVVIHRGDVPHLIDLNVFINDRLMNTFSSDGLIIATPTGSTAYSLSAGGPILSTGISNTLVITPICPHMTLSRSVVVSSDETIKVTYLSNYGPIKISCDGIINKELSKDGSIEFRRGPSIHFLKPLNYDYFVTLRSKLNWYGFRYGFNNR